MVNLDMIMDLFTVEKSFIKKNEKMKSLILQNRHEINYKVIETTLTIHHPYCLW